MGDKKITNEDLEKYIKDHYLSHTIPEIAKATGKSYPTIQRKYEALGITPMKAGERIERLILENRTLTFEEMLVVTDLSGTGLKPYLKKLDITLDKGKKLERKETESLLERVNKNTKKRRLKEEGLLGPIASRYLQQEEKDPLELVNRLRHGS